MKRILSWFSSWGTTLRIMIFERDLYRQLREPLDDDFTEVSRPESLYRVTLELSDHWWRHVDHVTREELGRYTQAWKDAGFGKNQVNQITLTGSTGEYTAYASNIFGIHATEE